ncbi:hypothetical protein AB9K41_27880 [Cribrihabitans sp. XS_ASV171]
MIKLRLNASHEAVRLIREENDFRLAADMLRSGKALSLELRELLAQKATGEFKGKRGPKKKSDTDALRREALRCMDWLLSFEGHTRDAAIREIELAFSVSERTVYEWLADAKRPKPVSAIDLMELSFFSDMANGGFGRTFSLEDVAHLKPARLRKFHRK